MSSLFVCLFHTRYISHVLGVFYTQSLDTFKIKCKSFFLNVNPQITQQWLTCWQNKDWKPPNIFCLSCTLLAKWTCAEIWSTIIRNSSLLFSGQKQERFKGIWIWFTQKKFILYIFSFDAQKLFVFWIFQSKMECYATLLAGIFLVFFAAFFCPALNKCVTCPPKLDLLPACSPKAQGRQ